MNSGSVRAGVRVQGPHRKLCDSGGLISKPLGVPVLQTQSPMSADQGQTRRSGSQTVQGGVRLAIGVFREAELTSVLSAVTGFTRKGLLMLALHRGRLET